MIYIYIFIHDIFDMCIYNIYVYIIYILTEININLYIYIYIYIYNELFPPSYNLVSSKPMMILKTSPK